MPKDFINSNKLVTLAELQYLLLEVLDRREAIPGSELSRLCKERSFNFAFAFENTIAFLQLISVIIINEDLSVIRNSEEDFEALKTEQDLSKFIIGKTLDYLKANNILQQVVNNETISVTGDTYTINTNKITPGFSFIKVLLLNFKIAETGKISNDQLDIFKEYKDFFKHVIKESGPSVPGIDKETLQQPLLPSPPKAAKFFISYSHKDEYFNDELKNHFSGLTNKGIITGWDGRAILPGEDWDDEIRKKLEQADIILFLVSSDFMASDYIRDVEIKKAIERHNNGLARIIPVLLRSCDYKSLPISRLQVVPKGAKPISSWKDKDAAYLNVVEQIKNILDKK